jgi:hypothetical protein
MGYSSLMREMPKGSFIPEKRFKWSRLEEDLVDVVEIGEICIYLEHPVGPAQNDGDDIEH